MTRRHIAIALLAFIAWGCAHRAHPERNVMHATGECDTDPRGGFAVDSLMPGTYHIRARAFNHRLATRDVRVRAARVDTVRIALQYYSCVGY